MEVPVELLPALTWPEFYYRQQLEYYISKSWQTWMISANGTGKTLLIYNNIFLQMIGMHGKQLAPPPIKVRVLVPSFDYVKDVALEKLQTPQTMKFQNMTDDQDAWTQMLFDKGVASNFNGNREEGFFELAPMLPVSWVKPKGEYSREHKGIEIINGSSVWFATSEQG